MSKLANMPQWCPGCHGQDPSLRHVDFEAYWDGPVLDQGNGMKQPIDDLVLCENCVAEAAQLIGYADMDSMADELAHRQGEIDHLTKRVNSLDRQNSALVAALQEKPQPRRGRPPKKVTA